MAPTKNAAPKQPQTVPASPVNKALKARWHKEIAHYRAARDSEVSGWHEGYEALGDAEGTTG